LHRIPQRNSLEGGGAETQLWAERIDHENSLEEGRREKRKNTGVGGLEPAKDITRLVSPLAWTYETKLSDTRRVSNTRGKKE